HHFWPRPQLPECVWCCSTVEIHQVRKVFSEIVERPEMQSHRSSIWWSDSENNGRIFDDEPFVESLVVPWKLKVRIVIVVIEREHHGTAHHCDAVRMPFVHCLRPKAQRNSNFDLV